MDISYARNYNNHIQSSAVITRANITSFSIWYYNEFKYASDVIFTEDTPYLALTGELRGVFCKDFGKNWPRFNDTALYIESVSNYMIV